MGCVTVILIYICFSKAQKGYALCETLLALYMYPHHISCPDYHCVCPPWAPYGRAQDPTYIPLQRTGNKAAQSAVLLLCARANGDPPFVRIGFTSFASSQPSNNLRAAARLVSDWDTGTQGMEPLEPESPRVEQVGGILSRGEDTDGERTDDEVDFPSEPSPSYVSQYDAEQGVRVQQCTRTRKRSLVLLEMYPMYPVLYAVQSVV